MRRIVGMGVGLISSFVSGADASDRLGLYTQDQFQTVHGVCQPCQVLPQTQWYFRHETVALPQPGLPVSKHHNDKRGADDTEALNPDALPELVWIGASQQWSQMTLATDSSEIITAQGERWQFNLVPKIASNHAYWNAETRRFIGQAPLSVRGELTGKTLVARTVWPL